MLVSKGSRLRRCKVLQDEEPRGKRPAQRHVHLLHDHGLARYGNEGGLGRAPVSLALLLSHQKTSKENRQVRTLK